MMKKIFFSLLLTLFSIFSFSQCVPNPIYQDSLPNVWPVSGFPDGTVGVSYSQIWTMKIPETLIEAALGDTAFVTVDTLGQSIYIGDWLVDSVKIMEVLNTPPGMSVDCNTSDCVFPGGTVACADINGIPTTSDWYNLKVITNLYSHGVVSINVGGVPLTLPVSLDFYDITGAYDTVSRYMITVNNATSIEHPTSILKITNLSCNNNYFSFGVNSNTSEKFQLSITDVSGRNIHTDNITTSVGRNEFQINFPISQGIYIISLQNKNSYISKKVNAINK
jgi:hypothetical protein